MDGSAVVEDIKRKYPALTRKLSISQLRGVADLIDQHIFDHQSTFKADLDEMIIKYGNLKDQYGELQRFYREKESICKEYNQQFGALKVISKSRKEKEEKAVQAKRHLEHSVEKLKADIQEKENKLEFLVAERASTPDVHSIIAELNTLKEESNRKIEELNEEIQQYKLRSKEKDIQVQSLTQDFREARVVVGTIDAFKEVNAKLRDEITVFKQSLEVRKTSENAAKKAAEELKEEVQMLGKLVKVQKGEILQQKKTIVGNERRK